MEIAKVSEQGQVSIPQAMRKAYGWEAGQELILIDTGEGVLIKPKKPFSRITLSEVAGCLKYQGTPQAIEEMNSAISQGIKEQCNRWIDLEYNGDRPQPGGMPCDRKKS
ncbi:AbrB/MazE/SpoVT family DNA-binding domain-containing protein [Phormidium pseudopriestleyi]|uniref:AbrB/MazE/SpoVT family DNA-binding domain-containing protein n=1 Tax=Phormidium pseudopriestleyi TaxID=1759527 RepID=UPI001F5D8DEB|nr:AbrB/MazE/SpoVT family DNA-binding domain-containing protein [Phormidium pseudopriestleyi]